MKISVRIQLLSFLVVLAISLQGCKEKIESSASAESTAAVSESEASCKNGKFECSGDDKSFCEKQKEECTRKASTIEDDKTFELTWSKKNEKQLARCKKGVFECAGDADWCAKKKERFCNKLGCPCLKEPRELNMIFLHKHPQSQEHLKP
mmetsp:Transcript_92465/g.160608  ORF Transcript_92465/g.160608 Transcript_92465/m.160608 type:complete len:150 (-) Transcript_92465:57-506(-)